MIRLTLILAGWALLAPAWAQTNAESPSGAADSQHALEQAYKKEYAFLVAQKRELQKRLEAFRAEARRKQAELEGETERLENQLLGLESEAGRVNDQLSVIEQTLQARSGDSGILDATLEQAAASLKDAAHAAAPAGDAATAAERVSRTFAAGIDALQAATRVRSEPGSFFLADGSEAEGQIVHYGRIASFGVSEQGSGALAPAGGGTLKVWPAADSATAEGLAAGRQPETLGLFLMENRNQAVADTGDKTLLELIQSGGAIAWIIVGLGFFAVLLAVMRLAFLQRAGANTQAISAQAGELVAAGRPDEAMALCEKSGGATAKVVVAALRNLDRDPRHLDDIISESILGESDYLDRFGALLLVIAAISPLLGLLGTVTGMISTFDVITEFGTGDPKLLSGGISTALVTTELGLIVAIPTLLVGNVLSGWADRIKDGMEKAALNVVNKYRERGAAA